MSQAVMVPTKGEILETEDYSIFKMLPHNRPVVQSHVIRLTRSMADRPHLRPARPVLVNDKMQVIDGQHRLKASELNGQSVFYMVVPNLTIEDARLLNALQRTWSLLDYAYSYASSKVPAYVQFIKAYESHELPPSTIVEAMGTNGSKARRDFRIGELKVMDQTELNNRLAMIEDVVKAFPEAATPYLVAAAFMTLLRADGYNHERMMVKIGTVKLSPQPDRISYVRELERAYNADVTFGGPNYLRFF